MYFYICPRPEFPNRIYDNFEINFLKEIVIKPKNLNATECKNQNQNQKC